MPEQDEKSQVQEKKTILVVEDDYNWTDSLCDFLEIADYEVVTAAHGLDALAKLDTKLPDIIISDIRMPEMNGFGLLHALKEREETWEIPFIFLSVVEEAEVEGLLSGADDYLYKGSPRLMEVLLLRVQKLIKRAEERKVFWQAIDNLENEHGEKVRDLNRRNHELFLENLRLRRSKSLKKRERLQSKIDTNKLETYRDVIGSMAHTLKGEFAHIGLAVNMIEDWPDLPDDVKEESEVIKRSLSYSSILLRRLLDYLEMGSPTRESVTVVDLMGEIESLVRPRIRSDVELAIHMQPLAGSSIIETNLEQLLGVVLELVKNASRALTEEGGRIEFNVKGEGDRLVLSVRDNGSGIPKELHDRILKEQVPSERGMGLGLHLSRKVIEALDGTLSLESTSSEGTVFSISLPVSHTQEEG